MNQYKFNKEELELFIEIYPHYTNKEIIDKFFPMLDKKSVMDRGYRLKLKKTEEAFNRSRKEANVNIGIAQKGKPKSESHKQNLSAKKKGIFPEHLRYERTEEYRERMSKLKKEMCKWSGENNPRHKKPLYGKYNGRWNGGSKQLYWDMREFISEWKENSMKFWDFKCVISGNNFDEIHHMYPFRKIVDETFSELKLEIKTNINEYTLEERFSIQNKLIEINNKYGIGICLEKDVHKEFHNVYGYKDFEINNFIEFLENKHVNTEVITKIKGFVTP